MSKIGRWVFHQITDKHYEWDPVQVASIDDDYDDASTRRYLARFGGRLTFTGKTVLDVGCGSGALCAEAVRLGASRAVGVDLERMDEAEANALKRAADAGDKLAFVQTSGDLLELGDQTFDVVISKDAMEHYDDPESFVDLLVRRVKPGGELVIGFSPLWKSPYGGHIPFMTPVPWAHLIFSEQTILAERRRFRPDEHPRQWSEIKGGLNQMTLKRFRTIMRGSALQPVFFTTNVSDHPAARVTRQLSRIKPLREYFTNSVYSIWRKPA